MPDNNELFDFDSDFEYIIENDKPVFDKPKSETDNDDFTETEQTEEEKPERGPGRPRKEIDPNDARVKIEAEMWAKTLQVLLKKTCSAWSGMENPAYGMTPEELDGYTQVTAAYIEAGGSVMSPFANFLMVTGALIIPAGVRAEQDRQKAKARKRVNAMRFQPNTDGEAKIELPGGGEIVAKVAPVAELERKRYEIVTNEKSPKFGHYQRDRKGRYLKDEEKNEMASPEIITIILNMKKQGASDSECNEAVIKYLTESGE